MAKAARAELDAGIDMVLKVRLSCSSACDLRGKTVEIIAQDAVMKVIELVAFDGTANETDEFVLKSPIVPGEYMWTAVFPAQEKNGILHEESSTAFSFVIKPHATSIAVWDIPSPIALGDEFKIKVGVQCSAECQLAGTEIAVYDHEGTRVATGTVGDVPWSGATALSGVEVELEAPRMEGRYRWTVKFPNPDLEILHEGASCTFAFGTARQLEHMVMVKVRDKDTKAPVENAHVHLRPHLYRGSAYKGCTDDRGAARVRVPRGDYQLYVSSDTKDAVMSTVAVDGDLTVEAELVPKKPWWTGLSPPDAS